MQNDIPAANFYATRYLNKLVVEVFLYCSFINHFSLIKIKMQKTFTAVYLGSSGGLHGDL